ncbi:uncharacterized protein MELLADRAFT_63721 [Melampsora larici-populina 98AG31]|uniref:Uncharacterized protein n=1 Tax=Melampsora larici-populina (strain 98AG31 / pathotype 3-4-7) TaxID=747676 RepID=F4RNR3_MELLP|nr:uncharacterized protein MELLADRAFT_63721 [Melampsora larici-populina 98AG31]EGG06049.1 hypothetical protein MELLADRAFT_63721 [Melampsora larici-populina 98AG31]
MFKGRHPRSDTEVISSTRGDESGHSKTAVQVLRQRIEWCNDTSSQILLKDAKMRHTYKEVNIDLPENLCHKSLLFCLTVILNHAMKILQLLIGGCLGLFLLVCCPSPHQIIGFHDVSPKESSGHIPLKLDISDIERYAERGLAKFMSTCHEGLPFAKNSNSRIDRLQVFSLSDKNYKFQPKGEIPSSTSKSPIKTIFSMATRDSGFSIYVKLCTKLETTTTHQTVLLLADAIFNLNCYIKFVMKETHDMTIPGDYIPALCLKGSLYQKTIEIALEVLQQDNLKLKERLWALGVLQELQKCLPLGELQPIREDVQEGAICRGILELSLIRGINLSPITVHSWMWTPAGGETNPLVLESLKRVELLLKLHEYLRITKGLQRTQEFTSIHDTLLQANFQNPEEALSVFERCENHIINEASPQGEVICLYHVVNHIKKIKKPATMNSEGDIIVGPLIDPIMNAIFENMYKRFKGRFMYEEEVYALIQQYLNRGGGDLYMENLVTPFLGWSQVTIKHYEYVFTALKAQRRALININPELLKRHPFMLTTYQANEDDVIEILQRASKHIPGAKDFMKRKTPELSEFHF